MTFTTFLDTLRERRPGWRQSILKNVAFGAHVKDRINRTKWQWTGVGQTVRLKTYESRSKQQHFRVRMGQLLHDRLLKIANAMVIAPLPLI